MSQKYDDSSIDQLKGAVRIRKRPASMLGSSGLAGARHGFTEIYGNALDEKSAGFGDRLDVKYYKDGSVSIRDYGRGVPLGWNDKDTVKNWNWHVIYNELYGGGKYETNQEQLMKITDWSNFDPTAYNYLFSVGLNGLGAASTQYTSEYFEVKSYRNGKCTSRSFERGIPLVDGKPVDMFAITQAQIEAIPEEICDTDEPNGTFIHWKPDDTVFDDVNIGSDWLLETCKDVAGVAGVELHFEDENTEKSIVIPSGTLKDIVIEHAGNHLLTDENNEPVILESSNQGHGKTKVEGKDFVWVCTCDIAFGFTKSEIEHSCYHNSVHMLSGVQYEAVQDAISAFMVEKGRANGVKIDKKDYQDAMMVAVSTYSNYASFRNQTKDAVDDRFIYGLVKDTLLNKLQIEYGKGNEALTSMVKRVLDEAVNRIQAEELRDIAKKAAKVKKEKAPDKFVSCDAYEAKRYSEVELWITEGDSAAGAVKNARNSAFQAIFPIRGKGLNVAKAGIKKVLANKEIREIFSILGTGFDLNIRGEKFFNMDDLKVGKIIIATDADEDGYQIRVLLFLTFYMLAPQLILNNKVFIAETPRFGLDLVDGTRVYARNDEARDELIAKYGARITKIGRYKGLGEVNKEILRETTVHPDTRTLIPVDCDLQNQTERDLIDALFGADKYHQRKSIISTVLGADVTDMLDDNALLIGEIDESDIDDGVEYETIAM
jgi:DNA gyrase subunit B